MPQFEELNIQNITFIVIPWIFWHKGKKHVKQLRPCLSHHNIK